MALNFREFQKLRYIVETETLDYVYIGYVIELEAAAALVGRLRLSTS